MVMVSSFLGLGCATGGALKSISVAEVAAANDAALAPCPGTDEALAQVLAGLSVDHAVMDEATGLAEFSHQTRAVAGLGAMFPALLADDWRVLLATPLVTKRGMAPDRLLVVGTRRDVTFEPMEAPAATHFEAVLVCAKAGHGYEVETLYEDLPQDQTLQYFGSDVVPRGDGTAVTFVHVMFATPSISEFTLDATGWGLLPEGKAARLVQPFQYGAQTLLTGFDGGPALVRQDAMAGSGWYPVGAGSRLVLLMRAIQPNEQGAWEKTLTLVPRMALEGGSAVSLDAQETWVWLGRGAAPAACGTTLHCVSAQASRGGYLSWNEGDAPYTWVAGAWDGHEAAVKALEVARVDLGAGQWMVDAATWAQRFDPEQSEHEPRPPEAGVSSFLSLGAP
jgi:hypothetical protein